MKKHGWNQKKFLIDGFPRNEENLEGWNRLLKEDVDVKFVLFLDCTEENMIRRIQSRGEADGANRRSDDNLDVLKKRFAVFREQSLPIVELFEKSNQVKRIDSNQSAENVWEQVREAFDGYLE